MDRMSGDTEPFGDPWGGPDQQGMEPTVEDPLHDEREEQRAARNDIHGMGERWPHERPSRDEL